jgi:hypothetical protein
VRIAVVMVGLALSALTAVGTGPAASARQRVIPCSESIDGTRFPYISAHRPRDRYRLVLGAFSVPSAHHEPIDHNRTAPWLYFFKAGRVIRAGGQSVVVSVPPAWQDRAAIAWGYGGKGVFTALQFRGCPGLPTQGFAYSGGFFLRSPGACLPLTFRVGHRSATIRFGLGRRCG